MGYSCCLVVPHFNHVQAFAQFLPRLAALELPCIVVDDGSMPTQLEQLYELLQAYPDITLIDHQQNRGKGAAMWTGAHAARMQGHSHMLQIDADGQHDTADVARFIADSQAHPTAIVSGAPQFDESAPKARVYGRKVTDFWVALETGSTQIKDSLCGFRVYPLNQFEQVFDHYHIGKRMDFDTDVLVKSVWQGIPIRFIDTKVVYLANSVSHFHYLDDNLRLIWLHTRLMTGMLVRLPLRCGRAIRHWLVKQYRAIAGKPN
ncbi:glycosyltransferase family 2 protein [Arenicella xantha]|uniref:GT2 family glycosyltransferase n=1 Tax=Arenicella xantha TaxID=644221 RepID=A0A395JQT1_9GAMM|nr:glycosyltransferase family 2 protein [Arenicella xantha]RBP53723.1 GT2 family glycosyltransferase [Arenicella xantha]